MFKKLFHSIVVSCLSLLLLFGSTAKEFVHLFAQHEDTIDNVSHVCPPGEAHFEHEHHHCSFLNFLLEPFSDDAFIPRLVLSPPSEFILKHSSVVSILIDRSSEYTALRGPPACAA